MKKILVILNIITGEFEFLAYKLIETNEDAMKAANKVAENYYFDSGIQDGDKYIFFGGTVATSVSRIQELNDDQFEVLKLVLQ